MLAEALRKGIQVETGPAYAAFDEADKGSIEPGNLAVLSADIMKIPEPISSKRGVPRPIVGREPVYQAEIP